MSEKERVKHNWIPREKEDRFECSNCGKIIGKRTLNAITSAIQVRGHNVAASLIYCEKSKEKEDASKLINWKKIGEIFSQNRVVAFEEITPFMGDDPELFWEGNETEKGMFDFLEQEGFEMIPCRTKGEELLTEIYVNFDKFNEENNNAKPDVSISEPAKRLSGLDIIKQLSEEIAKATRKGFVEIAQYSDGFKVFFSRELKVNDEARKQRVLEELSKDLNIEFIENQ